MSNYLTVEERTFLANNFRFSNDVHGGEIISFKLLLDKVYLRSYLQNLSSYIGSDKYYVLGSQFIKRYGYIMIMPILYSMTIYNKKLDIEVENCYLISHCPTGIWLPKLYLQDQIVREPTANSRHEWREELLTALFRDNVSKVLKSVANATGVSKQILWENIAIYVYWLFETRMHEGIPDHLVTQVSNDFDYLIHHAPGSVFNEQDNPLKKFFSNKCKTPNSTEPIRFRKTCCFYNEANSKNDYCKTCPRSRCLSPPVDC